jgi:SAM-dependent methyltransferase
MMTDAPKQFTPETIDDFGNQWEIHGQIDDDYWCDLSILKDYVGPLLDLTELKNTAVAEVGSGSGRIIHLLSQCDPDSLHAVEPSTGVSILRQNTEGIPNLTVHHKRGDNFTITGLNFIFSLGVIQFIEDPLPTLQNIRDNLKDGGRFIIWVYGKENNGMYLAIFRLIHRLTRRLDDRVLDRFCMLLNYLLLPYIFLCRYLPLPMRDYLLNVFAKCGMQKRKYIIFDQLNPSYVKYYMKNELIEIMTEAGFHGIEIYHRHGYSWTAIGRKFG